ncbi:lipocalin family protein [Winogradskyella aurantia]|uniref:Lipocalin-like domain-containing protein n=1 Tax=Winogradskyella aurantia TaxID=1915063 RepID=A0A265UQN6_9FLAO|nr:lipocalin family protein [Winogradskyella aurantia]OZV67609.1 hypothetical protein CA834_11710 [Winogradskyella aurantia]
MKKLLWCLWFIFISCSNNPKSYINHLEGYWEIQEVILSDGSVKNYKVNETIDYISLNDSLKGFRKKLKPGLNNNYFTSDDAEALTVMVEDDSLRIYYSTPFSKWKETVLKATEDQLKIINENKAVYLYKRYTPIQLNVE